MVATPPKTERPARLRAEDWAVAALDVIAEQGLAAVAVEPLARRLGVTKGSFYWHFPSREALLVAALERWEAMEQETVFGQLEDRKSTRLNSSHVKISYAVFCLKKKSSFGSCTGMRFT